MYSQFQRVASAIVSLAKRTRNVPGREVGYVDPPLGVGHEAEIIVEAKARVEGFGTDVAEGVGEGRLAVTLVDHAGEPPGKHARLPQIDGIELRVGSADRHGNRERRVRIAAHNAHRRVMLADDLFAVLPPECRMPDR